MGVKKGSKYGQKNTKKSRSTQKRCRSSKWSVPMDSLHIFAFVTHSLTFWPFLKIDFLGVKVGGFRFFGPKTGHFGPFRRTKIDFSKVNKWLPEHTKVVEDALGCVVSTCQTILASETRFGTYRFLKEKFPTIFSTFLLIGPKSAQNRRKVFFFSILRGIFSACL